MNSEQVNRTEVRVIMKSGASTRIVVPFRTASELLNKFAISDDEDASDLAIAMGPRNSVAAVWRWSDVSLMMLT